MAARRGTRSLGRSLPRTTLVWVAVVVVALVIVDVALVALALARTAPETHGTPGPIPTYSHGPSATAKPSASASPQAGAAGTTAHHLLSAVTSLEAWRASSTSCDAPKAVLEHTTDGGKTWTTVSIGDDVRTVTGMRATTDGLSVLVGVGDTCTDAVRTTTDDGATWKDGAVGAAGAGITSRGIVLGAATEQPPCADPVDAFRGSRTTVVVCDGQVEWREGTGAWVDLPLGGVRAIAVDGDEYTLARVGTPSCAGVQIETMPASGVTDRTTTTPIGCNHVSTDGPVALDRAGGAVWMWAGDGVAVSADGGATW